MKRIIFATFLALTPALGTAATLDANYDPTTASNAQIGLTYSNLGQSFTAINSGVLDSIELKIYRFAGSSAGDAIVDLYGFASTFGASLGSVSVSSSAVTTSSDYDWVSFDFSGQGIALTSGTQYGIGLYDGGATQNNQYVWNSDYSPNATYTGGSRFQSSDDGTSWSASSSDFGFRVNIAPSAVPLPASLPLLLVGLGGLTVLRRKKTA